MELVASSAAKVKFIFLRFCLINAIQVAKKVFVLGSQFFEHLTEHGYEGVKRWYKKVNHKVPFVVNTHC